MTGKIKKILIVEDNKDFLWILRQSFSDQDFSVIYAVDGEEGLEKAQEEKPDLMLVDILLPKMDGITMAKKAREQGVTSHIIFLTNLKDSNYINQAESVDPSGVVDYMVKADVRIDAIVERVKSKLGLT